MRTASRLAPILALLALAPPRAHAQADVETIRYTLSKEATFEAGCLPPCMCPVLSRAPLSGTFTLVRGEFDGLFQHYEVRDVDWRLSVNDQANITGSGSYKVGGEVAVQQQLTVDLSVDGAPAQRYDSGLVEGGGGFPRLDLPVALHGFFCHDSVYGVQAQPQNTGVIRTHQQGLTRLRASPNPFGAQTQIDFAVGSASRVELRIYDVSGRRIRTLVHRQPFQAGTYAVTWDGRRDDGAPAPAGVYFLGLIVGAREQRGRLVRF